MRALNRLLFSELNRIRGQAVAICAVLACGIATYVMSTSTITSIEATYRGYYQNYRFADLFVSLKRAPKSLAGRMRAIEGVELVETRVVKHVVLDVSGMSEPATCRLISMPPDQEVALNALHLRRGRFPNANSRGEVVASEQFTVAHDLRPGDAVTVIMDAQKEELTLTGIVLSPEYIYAVQPGQMLPDDRHFGVLWMPERQMAAAFNLEGAFNNALIKLSPRVDERAVIAEVDRLADRYGGLGAYSRDDQISHRRVADEIDQLRGMAAVSPTIFLAVAAFLFYLVLSRIIKQQQEEIAALRAFGYRASEIGVHYGKLLLMLVSVGVAVGVGAGVMLARWMVVLFAEFFRFPEIHHTVNWAQIPVAAGLGLVVSLLGGFTSIHRAMKLPPAVAMRPSAPPKYRRSLIERIGLGRLISPVAAMVLRRLERTYRATALSILGMSLGVAILVLGSFIEDTIAYVIDVQFRRAQRQDVMVTFSETASAGVTHDVNNLPGVWAVEPFRAVPVRLTHGHRSKRSSVMGLEAEPTLFRVLDSDLREVPLEAGGLTISKKLAELLDLRIGDEVQMELLEEDRFSTRVPIAAVFADYADPGAYLRRHDLHRLLREGERISGAFVSVDQRDLVTFNSELKTLPMAAAVSSKQAALKSFEDTIAENLAPMRVSYAIFASIISFGVIYSCAVAAFSERSRDLATLRVLGFTRGEVAVVLIGELAVITLAAIPVGLPLGYFISYLATLALDTETHRFPLVVSLRTFAYSSSMILAAAALSAFVVARMTNRLDMIAVLKVRD